MNLANSLSKLQRAKIEFARRHTRIQRLCCPDFIVVDLHRNRGKGAPHLLGPRHLDDASVTVEDGANDSSKSQKKCSRTVGYMTRRGGRTPSGTDAAKSHTRDKYMRPQSQGRGLGLPSQFRSQVSTRNTKSSQTNLVDFEWVRGSPQENRKLDQTFVHKNGRHELVCDSLRSRTTASINFQFFQRMAKWQIVNDGSETRPAHPVGKIQPLHLFVASKGYEQIRQPILSTIMRELKRR